MDENTTLKSITTDFPDLKVNKIKKIGEGTSNVAWEINRDIIFRFPKKQENQKQLEQEISVQGILKKYSSLPIPEFIFLPHKQSYVGYKKLIGTSLLSRLGEFKNWDSFSKQIGDLLSRLHAIPSNELNELSVSIEIRSFQDWQELGQTFYEKTKSLIPNNYFDRIEFFFHSEFPTSKGAAVFCHNDLGIEHILVTANKVTGVIDWGGTALTDPACDFARIYRDVGEQVLDSILIEYVNTQTNKNALRERAIFYGKCLFFEDLFYAIGQEEYMNKALAALTWMF